MKDMASEYHIKKDGAIYKNPKLKHALLNLSDADVEGLEKFIENCKVENFTIEHKDGLVTRINFGSSGYISLLKEDLNNGVLKYSRNCETDMEVSAKKILAKYFFMLDTCSRR